MYYRNNRNPRIHNKSKSNLDVGKNGEKTAEKYLKRKGYLFISRNYWTESGELDLIFLHMRTLVFVEVKTRTKNDFGTGREAVDFRKKINIKKTSKEFVRAHCEDNKVPFFVWKFPIYFKFKKIRFDVIEVSFDSSEPEKYKVSEHLKSYFS